MTRTAVLTIIAARIEAAKEPLADLIETWHRQGYDDDTVADLVAVALTRQCRR